MVPVALLGRTSEHSDDLAPGAAALACALDDGAELVGEPARGHVGGWRDDLLAARPVLEIAAARVDAVLDAGGCPLLTAGQCSIALASLPAVARRRPGATVLWLDAHGDFNTPETSPSGFLGGMPLAGACGVWDAGVADAVLDPGRVVLCGARDLDDEELSLLDEHGVRRLAPADALTAVDGGEVFVHLDVDVLDPSVLPSEFAAPDGMTAAALGALLAAVSARATVVGVEVTAFGPPADRRGELAGLVAEALRPLVAGRAQ